jgi:heme O synthase-like polyprenyltransferase
MMIKSLLPYYLSRTVLSIAFGLLLFSTGSAIWMSALVGGLLLALFLYAPHSGRYSVHPEFGVTALRRDERTQVINDKAARNAFVFSMLAIAALVISFGSAGSTNIPAIAIKLALVLGALVYFVSDAWLRKSQQ